MERNSPTAKEHDHKHNFRAGLKGKAGKLFGKDKKLSTENNDVSDFLYGPSDKLLMTTPTPTSPIGSQQPPIVRVDTANARRWPSAAEITGSNRGRGRSASPRRNRKGLAVQFTTTQPEVIGVGGDESEEPTIVISSRKRANSHPQRLPSQQPPPSESRQIFQAGYGAQHDNTQGPPYPDAFRPGPLRRTQTGYESIQGTENGPPQDNVHFQMPSGGVPDDSLHNGFIKSEPDDPNSFAAKVQAEMRRDEGEALTRAASTLLDPESLEDISADPASGSGLTPGMEQLQINTLRNSHISDSSSTNFPSQVMSELRPQTPDSYVSPVSPEKPEPDPTLSRSSTFTLQQAAVAVGDEALQDFSRRMAHLFTLFRLSTESVKPISTCSLMDVTRAAAWWFLKGRMNLEATVRDRPSSPEAQQYNFIKRQQAHADLAKALWLLDHVTPQLSNATPPQGIGSADMADISDTRQAIMTNLRKLTMSMKRNNFMPLDPDEAPLQQGLDPSIWVRDEGNRSLVSNQKNTFTMSISDGLPLGDTSRIFSYSRMFAEAILMEEDESQQYRCPALVSVVRGQKEKKLRMIITSANGIIQLCVQSDRSQGPIWEDVAWRAQNSAVDIKLPRGFLLRLQCNQHDFRALYGIYDYQNKIHASLFQHQDEVVAFEATVKAFQHFDQNPQSQMFPKEAVTSCQVRIFERLITEKAATGARKLHRGFRIAIVTGPKTRNLSGINQDIPPNLPVQFGFLRGEGGFPAFLLKFEDGSTKSTMVFTFNDVHERMQMHTKLTGTALADGESIVAEAQVKAFEMVDAVNDARFSRFLKPVEWQSIRVINEDEGDLQSNKTVLSQHLRVIMDFKAGSITDRLSVEPGELKLRLDVNTANELKVLRQKQQDMTISISEAQVPKELIHDAAHLLRAINESETSRIYSFPSLKELHLFQAALTGFQVLYDGFSASFNISRRRMVVPIYKKWDAEKTRLQIVQKEKIVQLVAFFENFSHGDCMNFALKGTDVYESATRSGKFQLKIVDAKFPMPKTKPEGKEAKGEGEHSDTGMESSFVSLDMPEYPGEHDDITIVFDTEAERERFAQALPAPVKVASRIGSIRK